MIYVSYYRVSTKKQSRSGLGLDAQRQMVRDFASANGTLVAEFVEVESGGRDNRAELAKAIGAAKKAKASLLIARLDRFSRRVSFISSMMEKGVPLIVTEMPNATDFQLHIFAALAQEERRLISIRTKAALAQAKLKGTQLGRNGRALAQRNKIDAKQFALEIRPRLPEGWQNMGYTEIAGKLRSADIPTRTGKSFHPKSVKNLIKWFDRGHEAHGT